MTSLLLKLFFSGLGYKALHSRWQCHKVKSIQKWSSKSDLSAQRKSHNSIQTNTPTHKAIANLHMHTFTEQNVSHDNLLSSHKYAHIHHTLSSPPVTYSESVILTVQSNSSFLYRMTIWFIAFCCVAVWAQIVAQQLNYYLLWLYSTLTMVLSSWNGPHVLFSIGLSMFYVDDRNIKKVCKASEE